MDTTVNETSYQGIVNHGDLSTQQKQGLRKATRPGITHKEKRSSFLHRNFLEVHYEYLQRLLKGEGLMKKRVLDIVESNISEITGRKAKEQDPTAPIDEAAPGETLSPLAAALPGTVDKLA